MEQSPIIDAADAMKGMTDMNPNNSFQRTRVRSGCGPGPLNSNR